MRRLREVGWGGLERGGGRPWGRSRGDVRVRRVVSVGESLSYWNIGAFDLACACRGGTPACSSLLVFKLDATRFWCLMALRRSFLHAPLACAAARTAADLDRSRPVQPRLLATWHSLAQT